MQKRRGQMMVTDPLVFLLLHIGYTMYFGTIIQYYTLTQ
jgi:hypothetical protein